MHDGCRAIFWKKCMALSLKQRKIRYNPHFLRRYGFGRVAQLVEHYLDMVVVGGSNPLVATIFCSPVGVGVHTSKGLLYAK